MRIFATFLAALSLSACVQSDGSPALGADDSQQVFTFVLTGPGSRGGHCTAEGAMGQVSSGTDPLGSPTVKIRGHVRQGVIVCTDGQGVKYLSAVNRFVPQGLRTPRAYAYLKPGRSAVDVELELPSNARRVFPGGLIRAE